jgi:hypothetical protein
MSAIRMNKHNDITVLIDPQDENGKTIKGVYLTRSYNNPSGILPEENIFLSTNEQWFYWLGYHDINDIPDTEENNIIVEKIYDYFYEYSSENQIRLFKESQCKQCNKQETYYCEAVCSCGLF